MKDLTDAVKKAIIDQNYHCAMFIALSLPDICGSIETPKERNGIRAKRWFKEYMGTRYMPQTRYDVMLNFKPETIPKLSQADVESLKREPAEVKLTPELFWSLRNAFLHEASDKDKTNNFHITHSKTPMMEINGAFMLSSIVFCEDMCEAVSKWILKKKADAIITERINSRAQITNKIMSGLYFIN